MLSREFILDLWQVQHVKLCFPFSSICLCHFEQSKVHWSRWKFKYFKSNGTLRSFIYRSNRVQIISHSAARDCNFNRNVVNTLFFFTFKVADPKKELPRQLLEYISNECFADTVDDFVSAPIQLVYFLQIFWWSDRVQKLDKNPAFDAKSSTARNAEAHKSWLNKRLTDGNYSSYFCTI